VRGSTSRVTRVSPTRSSTPRRRSSRASSRYFPSPHLIISARRLSLINCLTLQPIWATGPVHQSRPGGLLQGQREEGAGLPHVRRPVQGLVPRRWLHLLSFVCTTYVADPFTGKEIVSLTHKLIRCFFLFLVAPLALVPRRLCDFSPIFFWLIGRNLKCRRIGRISLSPLRREAIELGLLGGGAPFFPLTPYRTLTHTMDTRGAKRRTIAGRLAQEEELEQEQPLATGPPYYDGAKLGNGPKPAVKTVALYLALLLSYAALCWVASSYGGQVPEPVPAGAPPSVFSEGRAQLHLEQLIKQIGWSTLSPPPPRALLFSLHRPFISILSHSAGQAGTKNNDVHTVNWLLEKLHSIQEEAKVIVSSNSLVMFFSATHSRPDNKCRQTVGRRTAERFECLHALFRGRVHHQHILQHHQHTRQSGGQEFAGYALSRATMRFHKLMNIVTTQPTARPFCWSTPTSTPG
jgi:hypothetical protein